MRLPSSDVYNNVPKMATAAKRNKPLQLRSFAHKKILLFGDLTYGLTDSTSQIIPRLFQRGGGGGGGGGGVIH